LPITVRCPVPERSHRVAACLVESFGRVVISTTYPRTTITDVQSGNTARSGAKMKGSPACKKRN
jgi:hypothetical protein